ncbi:MAG TPA: PHB depolymerase family esterase [Acidobacteriota bacterium]|nr:PHB depolymerase family esterase [Acidobacteriota bacterium]HNC43683.1 PHB depolymerase family esterase [Acidobacteriota bacterium]
MTWNFRTQPYQFLGISFLLICLLGALGVTAQRNRRAGLRQRLEEAAQINRSTITESFQFEGSERSYRLHLPPRLSNQKAVPLVVVLHGGGGNAKNIENVTAFSKKADQEGFIVVYPNGYSGDGALQTWNAWTCCGRAQTQNSNDVGFIRELVKRLKDRYNIDPNRVFATGHSNGAMMAYRLGCEMADTFAAIGPVAGPLNSTNTLPSQPLSLIVIHGTGDGAAPYNGGTGRATGDFVFNPASLGVKTWVNLTGCNPTPQTQQTGKVIHETYTGGRNQTEVEFFTIVDGPHPWPDAQGFTTEPPSRDLNATDVVWGFFASHPRAASVR